MHLLSGISTHHHQVVCLILLKMTFIHFQTDIPCIKIGGLIALVMSFLILLIISVKRCGAYYASGDNIKGIFQWHHSRCAFHQFLFATYLKGKMTNVGLMSEPEPQMISDLHRRVQDKLNFCSVKVCDSFLLYVIQSPEAIHLFSRIIGEMSVIGIRKHMPKVDVERVCGQHDSLNMLQKIELFYVLLSFECGCMLLSM